MKVLTPGVAAHDSFGRENPSNGSTGTNSLRLTPGNPIGGRCIPNPGSTLTLTKYQTTTDIDAPSSFASKKNIIIETDTFLDLEEPFFSKNTWVPDDNSIYSNHGTY